jgi:hypothetical protein
MTAQPAYIYILGEGEVEERHDRLLYHTASQEGSLPRGRDRAGILLIEEVRLDWARLDWTGTGNAGHDKRDRKS